VTSICPPRIRPEKEKVRWSRDRPARPPSLSFSLAAQQQKHQVQSERRKRIPLAQTLFTLAAIHLDGWTLDAGMYEPLYLSFDTYPSVVPRVRVRGVMALFLAATILWALVW